MHYLKQNLIALTQGFNALLGGWGDESLSSRAHRQQHKLRWRLARAIINATFFWQTDHCRDAFEAEQQRRHLPPVLR